MKIRKSKKENYSEDYIIEVVMQALEMIEEDVKTNKIINNSTINTAEMLYADLKFFKDKVLEEE